LNRCVAATVKVFVNGAPLSRRNVIDTCASVAFVFASRM